MVEALLISPYIYNFSELIEQPLLQSLKNSENSWLFHILETFNKGDIDQFNSDLLKFKINILSHPVLAKNTPILQEKIRIMAFLDIVFNLPPNQRNLKFETVALKTQTPLNEVELLIMRTMALKLINGNIDQINSEVNVTWIVPRVLDL